MDQWHTDRIRRQQEFSIRPGSEENSFILDFDPFAYDSTVQGVMSEVLNRCQVLGTVNLEGNDVLVIVKDPGCTAHIGTPEPTALNSSS